MSANLEAKKLVVEEIKDKLSKSKSVTFVDYKGLDRCRRPLQCADNSKQMALNTKFTKTDCCSLHSTNSESRVSKNISKAQQRLLSVTMKKFQALRSLAKLLKNKEIDRKIWFT